MYLSRKVTDGNMPLVECILLTLRKKKCKRNPFNTPKSIFCSVYDFLIPLLY